MEFNFRLLQRNLKIRAVPTRLCDTQVYGEPGSECKSRGTQLVRACWLYLTQKLVATCSQLQEAEDVLVLFARPLGGM